MAEIKMEMVDVKAIVPYARNARMHGAAQVSQIARSIEQFGFNVPVLLDDHGSLIAGHGRLLAAEKLGLATVPAIRLSHLTEKQAKAYRIADNRIALNSTWDMDLLTSEIEDLMDGDPFDATDLGFDSAEIDAMLKPSPPTASDTATEDGDDPADVIPEAPRLVITQPGDVWLLGEHRLMCGSSTDGDAVARLMGDDRAALLFTSPPYGNQRNYTTGGIGDWDTLMRGVFSAAADAMAPTGQILVNLGLIHREGEWQSYWSDWIDWMRSKGWRRFGWYVWDQGPGLPGDWNGRFAPSFEFIFHFNREMRRPNKIIESKWAGEPLKMSGLRRADGTMSGNSHLGRNIQPFRIPDNVVRITRHKERGIEVEHPAVFPVRLVAFMMEAYADKNDVIFEPFSGSGTALLAGQRTGRRVRAMELAPQYVDLAIARWFENHPTIPVLLEATRQPYAEVQAERKDPAMAAAQ